MSPERILDLTLDEIQACDEPEAPVLLDPVPSSLLVQAPQSLRPIKTTMHARKAKHSAPPNQRSILHNDLLPSNSQNQNTNDEESISPTLACEICVQENKDTEMLVCDCCNQGYHMHCLVPKVLNVPQGAWFCGNCGGNSQRTGKYLDVSEDDDVLAYLAYCRFPEDAPPNQMRRIIKRSKNYYMDRTQGPQDLKLMRRPTGRFPARPVCPIDERKDVIESCHNLGHLGVLRTSKLVAERYYWGGIVQDVKDFIAACSACKLQNVKFTQPQQMQNIPISDQSFSRVGIDLVGPLQPSTHGNCYIVVAIDYLTKWPEVAALQNKTSKAVTNFFLHDVISRHGVPHEVLSDNGGEFQGDFEQLLQSCCIDHRLTSPNHPAANGLVERFNGTLVTALRKCVGEHPEDWDEWIPAVLLGYRCSVQASTRFSPFYMLYARQPILPIDNVESQQPAPDSDLTLQSPLPEECAELIMKKAAAIKDVIPKALKNIEVAQAKQRQDYSNKRKHSQPSADLKPGDFIVIRAGRRGSKLQPKADADILQLVRYANTEKSVVVVSDASNPPKRWKENVNNIALWQPSN